MASHEKHMTVYPTKGFYIDFCLWTRFTSIRQTSAYISRLLFLGDKGGYECQKWDHFQTVCGTGHAFLQQFDFFISFSVIQLFFASLQAPKGKEKGKNKQKKETERKKQTGKGESAFLVRRDIFWGMMLQPKEK